MINSKLRSTMILILMLNVFDIRWNSLNLNVYIWYIFMIFFDKCTNTKFSCDIEVKDRLPGVHTVFSTPVYCKPNFNVLRQLPRHIIVLYISVSGLPNNTFVKYVFVMLPTTVYTHYFKRTHLSFKTHNKLRKIYRLTTEFPRQSENCLG